MLHWTHRPASDEYFPLTPWTSLLAEVLSAGSYNLRHISLRHVKFYDSQLSKMIKTCCEDQCNAFKAVLEQNLGPLRMMRGGCSRV